MTVLDLALAYLREHPHTSAKTIAEAIGSNRETVYSALRIAEDRGECQIWKCNGAWLWEATQ